jgi:hypothetical protein
VALNLMNFATDESTRIVGKYNSHHPHKAHR